MASAHNGMEITVRFSITRDGRCFGKAAIRYASPDGSNEERLAYRISVAQAIERRVPFPVTEAFGNAIAGHTLNIKLTDRRCKSTDQPNACQQKPLGCRAQFAR